jgi:hypothetical protein
VEVYEVGVPDEFSTANGAESPSPAAESHRAWGSPRLKDFDRFPQGWVFHTFLITGTDESPICDAILLTRVKPDPSDPLTWNDNIQFSFGDGLRAWIGSLGTGTNAAALFPYPWGSGARAAENVTLSLKALPMKDGSTTDLIARINETGLVDVIEHDDSAADYFVLQVERCCDTVPTATDLPPTETPTVQPETATPTFTSTAVVPSSTPTPTLLPTTPPPPTSAGECVCTAVRRQVPSAAIVHALVNPEEYFGWGVPLDPGKPP